MEPKTDINQINQPELSDELSRLRDRFKVGRAMWIVGAVILFLYLMGIFWMLNSAENNLGAVILYLFSMPIPIVAGSVIIAGLIKAARASVKMRQLTDKHT